jgi:hypothetical protein
MYKCEKCSQEFKYKSHYNRHINKKFDCINDSFFNNKINLIDNELIELEKNINKINDNIVPIDNNIKIKTYKSLENGKRCLFCKSNFLYKKNILRHIRESCLINKNILLEKENLIQDKVQISEKKKNLIEEKNKILEEKNKLIKEKRIKEREKERDNEIKQLRKDIAKLLKK